MEQGSKNRIRRKLVSVYLSCSRKLWNHLPAFLKRRLGQTYGRHLHELTLRHSTRRQSFGTYFLRNRPELELMRRLLEQMDADGERRIAILGCSKGAEVHSISWFLRSQSPKLNFRIHAVDLSPEIVEFAERGVYALRGDLESTGDGVPEAGNIRWGTQRDQVAPIFERMSEDEIEAMCEIEGDYARIRPWVKEESVWLCADACDPALIERLGPQDLVIANRFLCHMDKAAAGRCLRGIARLVKPGGYLFVSGVDLDVRTKVAAKFEWTPVKELMREVHEGDPSLLGGWPFEYWGLEPFCEDRPDRDLRYSSVFQIGAPVPAALHK